MDKIIKQISNDYTVASSGKKYICKARGKFRNLNITPLVGDNVIIDKDKNIIVDILPRKNELTRPSIANVDQALIVTSVKIPDFSSTLLDKLLNIIEFNKVTPIICFTKLDLLSKDELDEINKYIEYYKKIGYKVFVNTDIELKNIFKDKITVFVGQSGAGKSSLLNRLDSKLNLKTGEVSYSLNRGKHTTRHTELIDTLGGLVADTPGFSALDFDNIKNVDIKNNFIEFRNFENLCEYKDCMHINELKCGVKENVKNGNILKTRYDNYLKFIKR